MQEEREEYNKYVDSVKSVRKSNKSKYWEKRLKKLALDNEIELQKRKQKELYKPIESMEEDGGEEEEDPENDERIEEMSKDLQASNTARYYNSVAEL